MEVAMNQEETVFAVSFQTRDEALLFLNKKIHDGLDPNLIVFKDNVRFISSNILNQLYKDIFGKRKNIFYKDYITNESILPVTQQNIFHKQQVITLQPLWQTFRSLMNYLGDKPYLIIYKIS